MISIINREILHRIIIFLLGTIASTVIIMQYANDMICWIINPLIQINNDFHNKIVWSVINNAYNAFDTECRKHAIIHGVASYVPSYEINIRMDNMMNISIIVMINAMLIIYFVLVYYNVILVAYPSLYNMERIGLYVRGFVVLCRILISIITTHNI